MSAKPRRGWWWKGLLLGGAVLALVAIAATATSVESSLQQAKTGTVIEVATQKPIAGAYIVVRSYHDHVNRWMIGHGGKGGIECVYRAIAQTDANGHYTVPSSEGKFDVRREFSVQFDNRYYWDLDVYAPGYSWVWPQRTYHTEGGSSESEHPATSFALTGAQQVDPIELTAQAQNSSELSLNEFPCAGYDGNAVPFFATMYREAYGWACEQGGRVSPRRVADLREHAWGALPPLSSNLSKQLDGIRTHYRFNDPPSKDDDAQICAILKQANEEAP
jgi:hypothetical protein